MNYYKIALKGYFLDPLIYKSDINFDILNEVIIELGNKKNIKAIILEKTSKPDFEVKDINSFNGKSISQIQFDLALFISSYYVCKIAFVLGMFESSIPYIPKTINIKEYPILNDKQKEALDFIKKNNTSLLFADTGSGKTEIYINLIKEYIALGKQVLLLMPEIALTPQMKKRLKIYFDDIFFVWHSKITKKTKEKQLQELEKGNISLVVGARSALFLPYQKLDLIIIDEEHDNSYKSSYSPRINAKDLAIFLGQKTKAKVLLGSATPSLNSFYKQKYFRIKGTFFDSKKEFIFDESELGLSDLVLEEIKKSLINKKQIIIFLPTRANFRQILCKSCGKTINCPHCSVAMSLHKQKNSLKCHYCNFTQHINKFCPSCNNIMLEAKKIGTAELCSMLEKELKEFNPIVKKFDSDEISTFKKLNTILQDFNNNKIDILVGTSMLAKGHDYHNVDLSIILGLDEYLFKPNYKAKEESLALAIQVAGRAGRKGKARVLIQSLQKEFWQNYINDYDAFLKNELKLRNDLYPPYCKLLRIIIEDKNKEYVKTLCQKLVKEYKKLKEIELIGYGPCGIELINDKFRFYILLRHQNHMILQRAAIYASQFEKAIIDMDPIDFS